MIWCVGLISFSAMVTLGVRGCQDMKLKAHTLNVAVQREAVEKGYSVVPATTDRDEAIHKFTYIKK